MPTTLESQTFTAVDCVFSIAKNLWVKGPKKLKLHLLCSCTIFEQVRPITYKLFLPLQHFTQCMSFHCQLRGQKWARA